MKEIFSAGKIGVPALMINGKLMVTGSVPPKGNLREWLLGTATGRG